jgi:hypothetical protein
LVEHFHGKEGVTSSSLVPGFMASGSPLERLGEAARVARHAEARGDDAAAVDAWRRYRLIRDAARDPDELLAEGVALSEQAIALAGIGRAPR